MSECHRIDAVKRRVKDRLLRFSEHEGIVNETDSRLYIPDLLARETTPGNVHLGIGKASILVDAYCAVVKVRHCPVEGRTDFLVCFRFVWDQQRSSQRSPYGVIGEGGCFVEKV